MRIGIFGGTFDPPHLGHLILAAEALDQLTLDRLLWVLTPKPPHKEPKGITPVAHRRAMVEAAIRDNPAFSLSTVDMDRPGPHYAVDTVRLLQTQFPQGRLLYLMGGDSLHDLPQWHRPRDFLAACYRLGVMRRPADQIDLTGLEAKLPEISKKVRFVDAPLLEISSSQIRRRIAAGRPYRYFLPVEVVRIIGRENLYNADAIRWQASESHS